jgi:hypothetical protein
MSRTIASAIDRLFVPGKGKGSGRRAPASLTGRKPAHVVYNKRTKPTQEALNAVNPRTLWFVNEVDKWVNKRWAGQKHTIRTTVTSTLHNPKGVIQRKDLIKAKLADPHYQDKSDRYKENARKALKAKYKKGSKYTDTYKGKKRTRHVRVGDAHGQDRAADVDFHFINKETGKNVGKFVPNEAQRDELYKFRSQLNARNRAMSGGSIYKMDYHDGHLHLETKLKKSNQDLIERSGAHKD